jgi:hypothetical protein
MWRTYVGLMTLWFMRVGPQMSRAEQYLNLAAEVRARAEQEDSPILRAEWENLAETYVRLAEQSGAPNGGATYDPIQEMLDRANGKKKKR